MKLYIQGKKKRKISKFVDAGSNNWNETEGKKQNRMDQQGRVKKENKTLGTGRRRNIAILYLNKK